MRSCSPRAAAPRARRQRSPSPIDRRARRQGLIAYVVEPGVGVIDPATGKSTVVAPLPRRRRVSRRRAGLGPGARTRLPRDLLRHPRRPAGRAPDQPGRRALRLAVPRRSVHRGRSSRSRRPRTSRAKGRSGSSPTPTTSRMTVGCCTDYQVDVLDLTQPVGPDQDPDPPARPARPVHRGRGARQSTA